MWFIMANVWKVFFDIKISQIKLSLLASLVMLVSQKNLIKVNPKLSNACAYNRSFLYWLQKILIYPIFSPWWKNKMAAVTRYEKCCLESRYLWSAHTPIKSRLLLAGLPNYTPFTNTWVKSPHVWSILTCEYLLSPYHLTHRKSGEGASLRPHSWWCIMHAGHQVKPFILPHTSLPWGYFWKLKERKKRKKEKKWR